MVKHADIAAMRRLRESTGATLDACRRALVESGGDEHAAASRIVAWKRDDVMSRASCDAATAEASLARANGDVERAIELARLDPSPRDAFGHAIEKAHALRDEGHASLGLHELRDALALVQPSVAAHNLELVLEFWSILTACDIETFLDEDDGRGAKTLHALRVVGATTMADLLARVLDGPAHMDARARIERECFDEEAPLLAAALAYVAAQRNTLVSAPDREPTRGDPPADRSRDRTDGHDHH